VLVIALLARSMATRNEGVTPAPPEPLPGRDDEPQAEPSDGDEDAAGDEQDGDEVVAVTSDGAALVPDAHAVRMVPPHEEGEAWKAGDSSRNRRGEQALAMSWHAGEFTGLRIVRGEADEAPWRLEALGRDGEYTVLLFETREGADAAVALFESRRIVRLGIDDEGRPMPPSAEQFAEARRIFFETEAALDAPDPEE